MRESRWLQVSVSVESETAEAVSEVLARYVEGGAVMETHPDGRGERDAVLVKGFLAPDSAQDRRRRQVEQALWHLGQIRPVSEPQFTLLAEADWAEAWKADYRPQRVGRRLVVVPSWISYEEAPGEIVLRLDPGMAFGTGAHPTTQLCLESLEEHLRPGTEVLDLGTGSGILAIACAKLGAEGVLALDTDPAALQVARANVRANGVGEKVELGRGSEEMIGSRSFDLIVVNILANTIIEQVENGLLDHLDPSGIFIAGGVLSDWEAECRLVLAAHDLDRIDSRAQGDWVTLMGTKGA
ncbi:MAG: 50S ribosomal protein L11 methyltransferase [Anaerolineae bacterium]